MLRFLSHFSVILTIVKNEWLATNSQNAILNNYEKYYVCLLRVNSVWKGILVLYQIELTGYGLQTKVRIT